MKSFYRSVLLGSLALLGAASLVSAAVPKMDVVVTDSAGKTFFKGKTDAQGVFNTKPLAPGNYVVQLNSDSSKGGPYGVVIAAGKKKVVADSVPASKFTKGGVALRVEVTKAVGLTGQVALAGQTKVAADGTTMEGNVRVKYINGKKFVWVPGELGSNLGGHWVDANSPQAHNVQSLDSKSLQDIQSRGQRPGG